MKPGIFTSKKHASRIAEIIKVLSKYGLASWLDHTKVEFVQRILKDSKGAQLDEFSFEEKIRKACEELGPAFIKLGQVLSTRPDLVGQDLANELTQLQISTPPDDAEWVRELITSELGDSPEKIFKSFNYSSIASASIGQVHEAITVEGQKVAVKLIHKGIPEKMKTDLNILIQLSEMAERYVDVLKKIRFSNMILEFNRILLNELNFKKEAQNLRRFQMSFQDEPELVFPMVIESLSTSKILTMNFEEGTRLSKIELSDVNRYEMTQWAKRGARMYLDMIFRDNFYHGDPHPGNLLLNENNQLVILDCGMVGSIDSFLMEDIEDMLFAMTKNDPMMVTESIFRVCEVGPDVSKKELASEIDYWLKEYLNQNFDDLDIANALNDFNKLIRNYEIIMPGNLAFLFKVLVQLDGTARLLDPKFNVMQALESYYGEIMKRKLDPKRILVRFFENSRDWYKVINLLPKSILGQLEDMDQGKLNLRHEHKGLESSVNRLVLGIIAASVFIGSAILWSFQVPPLLFNSSVFGFIGYFIALVLIFKLIRDIFRA